MCQYADHPAVVALQGFFAAMHDWEIATARGYSPVTMIGQSEPEPVPGTTEEEQAAARAEWYLAMTRSPDGFDEEAFWAEAKRALTTIFEHYCAAGGQAGRLRPRRCSFMEPPQYDADQEWVTDLIDLPEGGVTVETRHDDGMLKHRHRYHLTEREGRWLIRDHRQEQFRDWDWEQYFL